MSCVSHWDLGFIFDLPCPVVGLIYFIRVNSGYISEIVLEAYTEWNKSVVNGILYTYKIQRKSVGSTLKYADYKKYQNIIKTSLFPVYTVAK
ncbi:hypothetical protein NERG_00668 [Nematocida ausubeli]|uniref:Uncharacterized protein n=1 Tax=Nematocida ausubeli (strain ATCC PRA-371 / ERTm2) TaxID=1913371 RepID=H8ZAR9_NEMA1|nr:hypothetical protein NERG_00668 [Nematocida ausubeli]